MAARRGRPAFKPTLALRRTVEQLVSVGESHESVARAVGCSRETLEKHFVDELATGASRKRREVVDLLYKSARAGNVSAIKKLEEMTGAASAAEGVRSRGWGGDASGPAVTEPAAEARPEKLGKKEEQQRAAEQVGGKYAVPSAPKLVVVNE
ncbi:hypothetical protein [Methylopila sp. Yamaguchi]|uniref:hypothetical protein n=1 Tax=Methylopila sp. Yamaguchi TaxID=1437817 RepID=UPI000CBC2538|nr:hypothetical protein [Methylopila sp. Yamaguchi]GBD48089.1 hypothetical protein METY_1302 [Methylopila sp. Yamaguchi]